MIVFLAQQATGRADVAEVVLFVLFGGLALGAAVAMVLMRNVVHAALMLVLNFLSIAALYLTLQSAFLSIIQVLVYAGAIMVLFLFVIMLLGVDRDDLLFEVRRRQRVAAVIGVGLVAGALLFGVIGTYTGPSSRCGAQAPDGVAASSSTQPCVGLDDALAGNDAESVGVVADRMFGRYTFPFELAAVLLTIATIGAMLLGRRTELTQEEDRAWVPSVPPPDDSEAEMAMAEVERSERTTDPGSDVSFEGARIAEGHREDDRAPLVSDDPEVSEAQRRRRTDTDVERGSEPGVERGSEPGVERGSEPGNGEDA